VIGGGAAALQYGVDVTGWTESNKFPLDGAPAQSAFGGVTDVFALRLLP
jgi:hypothetical protein